MPKYQHPGVTFLPPNQWRSSPAMRWRDPDSGKIRTKLISSKLEAVAQSQALLVRKLELEAGAQLQHSHPLQHSLELYFSQARVRSSTLEQYGYSSRLFSRWAEQAKLRSLSELTLPLLRDFRAHLAQLPDRSTQTLNRDLRQVALILEHLRKAGHLPRLPKDQLRDGLQRFKATQVLKPPLTQLQIRTLAETRHPLILAALLSGMRRGELLALSWDQVRLHSGLSDRPGARPFEGELTLPQTKTHPRTVDLAVSPGLKRLLDQQPRTHPQVFPYTVHQAVELQHRLQIIPWTWQALRRTAGTYLACAPGIWGAASVYLTARQLGHSVEIAQRHYLGRVRISPDARTLEAALGIEDLLP